MKTEHRESRRKSLGGFTLTELVVLLVVILILTILLLPMISRAGVRSLREQCMGNLRQLDAAVQLYASENQDLTPRIGSVGSTSWVWDFPWQEGLALLPYGLSFKSFYDPGTQWRFADTDNATLWNYSAGSFHVINYAPTLATTILLDATNVNTSMIPPPIHVGANILPPAAPAARVLWACGCLQILDTGGITNWTDITGGYTVHHTSSHLNGKQPAGGNLGMLDGHVEWRPFSKMSKRTDSPSGTTPAVSQPGYWW